VNFDECGAIVTEPYFNFTSIREALTEVLFEDYQFQFLLLCNRKSCLWSPYGIGQTIYIFMLWFVLSSSSFFSWFRIFAALLHGI